MLNQLGKVPYATVYNFQPWTAVNKQADLKSSLHYPDNLMKSLRRSKIVSQVAVYPLGEEKRHYRHNTFYTLKLPTGNNLSQYKTYNGSISLDMLRHQSGLIDIFLAFINLYPDYLVEIDWNKEFPYSTTVKDIMGREYNRKKTYCPDAFIRMTAPNQKQYDFIIEFERTKGHEQIKKEKFNICNSIKKFGSYGLSRHTRFLFFYTYELYNVYARPIEYQNEEIKKHQQVVENRLNSLIRDNKKILTDNYRFLPFHNCFRLNESIWLNSKGERVPLVN